MVKITKRDGRKEEFDSTKIERSLRASGVSEEVARDVTSKVEPREGMTVDEIRTAVSKELRTRDAKLADRYDDTRHMTARSAVEAAEGTVKMTEEAMRTLRVNVGDHVELSFSGNMRKLRAEKAPHDVTGIQLHESELKALGAHDGVRIAVRRHP